MTKYKYYFKIALVLVMAFGGSFFFKNEFFVGDTAQLKPHLNEYVAWSIKDTAKRIAKLTPFYKETPYNRVAILEELKKNLKPVAKGVRAAEDRGVSYTKYTLDEVEYTEIKSVVNGKEITIRVPKGLPTPPQELFERLNSGQ